MQPTRFFAGVMAALLSVILAACGGPEATTADPGAPAATEAPDPGAAGADTEPPDLEVPADASPEELYAALAGLPWEQREAHLLDCAQEEGEVVWYAAQNVESLEAWANDFMELHPEIEVGFSRGKSPDTTDKVLSEARAGRHEVDVIMVGGPHLSVLRQEELLAEHHRVPVPEDFPENAVGDWWFSVALIPNVITYNTNLVSAEEAPQSYEDLLEPQWKGKVAIDLSPQNMVVALVREWGEDRARQYLEELVIDNDALVRKGHTNITNLLAAGEFPIAIELYAYKVAELIDQGAPLAWVAPDPMPTNTEGTAIAKNAPHPCSAALFMNYLLSERGGDVYAQFGRLPNNPNVEPLYENIADLLQDPRISPNTPDNLNPEEVNRGLAIIEEVIVPVYSGQDG